ncbi:MAG: hypothetical protein ACQEP0_11120 [Natrinema limicola]
MVLSWAVFVVLDMIGAIRRGFTLAFGFGTLMTAMGITTLLDPRLQGARDMQVIQSEAVGPGERFGAQVVGVVLILFGVLVVGLFLFIGFHNSFGD